MLIFCKSAKMLLALKNSKSASFKNFVLNVLSSHQGQWYDSESLQHLIIISVIENTLLLKNTCF